ncbi:hypothetical protein [Streptomyces sp. VRA16 Mangrove soil]|uniref:hypothetical protein n=1 Tax=Streptomyces sp. VRA16 Mangrove soil TaxID=2817434 RepID=UPI001A9F2D03|nr:hypothetical protein [Streptomyces sp. VRA16 Mangrove soil]MBO1336572.1 hypothetical protein [Streptomyces sp. VRA16 Mangrove soil]
MRSASRAAALLAVAAALPLALTACSSGGSDSGDGASAKSASKSSAAAKDPNAGLATGAQLKKALAPASFFGSGYKVDPSTARDTGTTFQPQKSHPAALAKPDCTKFGGTSWIALTGDDGVSFAQNDYMNADSTDIAQEIDVFRGAGAQTVMAHLEKVVAACPGYHDKDTKSDVKVTGATTSGLGDGAYTITLTDPTWTNGTTLIAVRKGTAVVTVMSTDGHDNGAATAKKLAAKVTSALGA